MSANENLRGDRLKKIDILTEAGMEAYPVASYATATCAAVINNFDTFLSENQDLTVAGRVMSRRGQGGIVFLDLYDGMADADDGSNRLQVVLQRDSMNEALFDLFSKTVDMGDFVEVTGKPYLTKRGEKSLNCSTWRMLAKSLQPIPSEWFGIKDEEKILRERYLDILLNPEVKAMFMRRSKFWRTIRTYLDSLGYSEMETPVLETSPGGADARPFATHHNALDMDVYLRISLELWLKRLLVAGFTHVYEIGRIFRNEGQSREHLQDYTQLELYCAYVSMKTGMQLVQDMYRTIVRDVYGKSVFEINGHTVDFAAEWQTIDYVEAIEKEFGINAITCTEDEAIDAARGANVVAEDGFNKARAIDALWKMIRKKISGPAFLIGVPVYLEPLAKRTPGNPDTVERFQVILAGSEMGKGFSELNDPVDQRARFEEQQAMRDAGDDEAQRLDEEFVQAMEYGMPPAFGFGLSERLFSFLENRPAHEAQLFPLLRPKSES